VDAKVVEMGRTVYLTVPRWLQGRVDELGPGLSEIYGWLSDNPNNEASRLFLIAHAGQRQQARRDLEAFFARGDWQHSPLTPRWPALTFFLATTIATLDMAGPAEVLFDALLPQADLNCVYFAFIFYGTYAYHLGRLALVLDRRRDAEHLLALALTRHRALAATPWIALTEAALREPTT
jgi:hypothetical protein